ncbi:MAG: NADH-quinone oxidoreductase subunit J [Bacillota bacterium]|nr:NADH-quinone oxidoreductase subunit J [Bacillota bacterium]MDP4156577.1 NADH-quinone oxidoreductase subunit J [Bacillota bacterium]
MTGEFFAFICLALVAIIGGVLLLNLTKVVQIIVALSFTFISIAGIYILLSAEFVAGVQVMIYSGAISIIMLFGIMLTRHDAESEETGHKLRKFLVFLGVLGFAFAVYLGIYNYDVPQVPSNLHVNNTLEIGKALYSKYTIPFELASVLLLVGLVGAIVLSKKDDKEGEN